MKLMPKFLLRKVLIQYTTTTTVHYVEASVLDRYYRNSEKAWVAATKWLLYKTKVVK